MYPRLIFYKTRRNIVQNVIVKNKKDLIEKLRDIPKTQDFLMWRKDYAKLVKESTFWVTEGF